MKRFALVLSVMIFTLLYANDFRFYVDYATFYDEDEAFVELYFMLPRYEMGRQDLDNGQLKGKYLMALNIYRDEEKVYSKTLSIDDFANKADTIRSTDFIPELHGLHLSGGQYRMNTLVRDMVSGKMAEKDTYLKIPVYDLSELSLSDIQVASIVGRTDSENKFTKLGVYDIIPRANPEFDKYIGGFFTYFEVYKLTPDAEYEFTSCLKDLNGKIVKSNKSTTNKAPREYDILIDRMELTDVPGGIYHYHACIKDKKTGAIAEKSKQIYMIREEEINVEMYDQYVELQHEQLDSLYRILQPLMSNTELKNYKNANLDGKRHIFIEFWRRRDSNMSTPVNEYYVDIMQRIDYAYEQFTYLNKGPRSERGRVLLKYGYPTEVGRGAMGGNIKDHEIWVYEGMRGKIKFIFCDTQGRGYYELIHSDMEGEISNENWQDVLTAGARNY